MNEQELAEFVARLPAHLRVFFEPPPEDLEPDAYVNALRERLDWVRRHREELLAHGVAADRFLADMAPKVEDLAARNAEVDLAEDRLLNAQADRADAEYSLFLALKQRFKAMEEENPFAPEVEELREQLEELAENFPKE